jgi:hypothetical protein
MNHAGNPDAEDLAHIILPLISPVRWLAAGTGNTEADITMLS